MKISNKILHSYAIYCRKEMVKIFKCYLIPKKRYDTLSKGAIFFGQPCTLRDEHGPIRTALKVNLHSIRNAHFHTFLRT